MKGALCVTSAEGACCVGLREVKGQLLRNRHLPVPEQGRWPGSVVRGHRACYAVPVARRAGPYRWYIVTLLLEPANGPAGTCDG
jgi:hypothetical protein